MHLGVRAGEQSIGPDHVVGAADGVFVMFDDGRFLDGQYTVWGEVVEGMEFVDQIKRGEPPANPDKIVRMQVAADAG